MHLVAFSVGRASFELKKKMAATASVSLGEPNDWQYVNEGNLNIVFSYVASSSDLRQTNTDCAGSVSLSGKVLRINKELLATRMQPIPGTDAAQFQADLLNKQAAQQHLCT